MSQCVKKPPKSVRPLVSCFECAGIVGCHNSHQPELSREGARAAAASCAKLEKGRTTEIVAVAGRDRGMSRKKAQGMADADRARWVAAGVIELL